MEKTTLVIGASENEERYSNKAIRMLRKFDQPTLALGLKEGHVLDVKINTEFPVQSVDTMTLYVSEKNQGPYISPIMEAKPRRVIFNPGTENPAFEKQLEENGIEALRACTLVLLSTNQY